MGKKFYITTAIDYTNARPHIGHALEKIQADVLARYARLKGKEVWFLTGTDEHGVKIARAAEAAGKKPQEFVDGLAGDFKHLKEALNLSWDDFIRTTDRERHWPGTVLIWKKLAEAGDIYKKKYRGLYCVGHEAFVTEKDLIDGKCEDHGKAPEVLEEENYFFKLSKYSKQIGTAIKKGELQILPEGRRNEILSLIEKEGLRDVSFSRPRKDLSWGIPVPGDDTQTMYVWCDALANYLSAIGYGRNDDWKKWWPADVHVIGKDILRFHAAIWPGMLLAANLPLPKAIYVHGFINVEGKKISKLLGNVIDPFELTKKYGTDAVRYFLLRGISAYEDGDFSEVRFTELYNSDLANGIGNLVQRVTTLAEKAGLTDIRIATGVFEPMVRKIKEGIRESLSLYEFHRAIERVWELVSAADKYVNETKVWEKEEEEQKKILADLTSVILNIANLLDLFLPATAEEILRRFGLTVADIRSPEISKLTVKKGEPLFKRL